MWRVNKGIAKDLLPAVPLDVKMEGWWIVNVVNVGMWSMAHIVVVVVVSLYVCDDWH